MSAAFESITQIVPAADLGTIMDVARTASSRPELRDRVLSQMSAPLRASRRAALKMFRNWYLDGDVPADEPSVLAWHAFEDVQTRRELLHVERCRHIAIIMGFLSDVLYPRLLQGQPTLFGDPIHELVPADIDAYVTEHLPYVTDRTRHTTRRMMGLLLVEAGLLQRTGTNLASNWQFGYYRPTWRAWLYGLYRELEDAGQRQRSERYIVEESNLTRAFLLRASDLLPLLAEGNRRGCLDTEFFGGERYYRLVHASASQLVRALGATGSPGR